MNKRENREVKIVGPSGCNDHLLILVFALNPWGVKASVYDHLPASEVAKYRFTNPEKLYRFWQLVQIAVEQISRMTSAMARQLLRAFKVGQQSFEQFILAIAKLVTGPGCEAMTEMEDLLKSLSIQTA